MQEVKTRWLAEERDAHIHGWDFSHIADRYAEETDLPWDYEAVIRAHLAPQDRLLDIDTGGGEFLLGLKHPHARTSATEGYPPNVALCRSILAPLGIDFREAADVSQLPFESGTFDVVINRHGDFDPEELYRILKPGGLFITQQVGAENDRALVDLLLPGTPVPYPEQRLENVRSRFMRAGFQILQAQEAFCKIRFWDVGALVWFARVIPWEFPGFSVECCFDRLVLAQQKLETQGVLEASTHRFLLVVKKLLETDA